MKRPGRFVILLLMVTSLGGCEWLENLPESSPSHKLGRNPLAKHFGEISSLDFEDFLLLHESGSAIVFDARPAYYYQLGHIPGALHLSAGEQCDAWINQRLPMMQQAVKDGKTIVVYCNGISCRDARTVSRHISRRKIPVSIFTSGWKGWKKRTCPSNLLPKPPTDLPPHACNAHF